jgi:DNA-binding XRE family transcriptional regulator
MITWGKTIKKYREKLKLTQVELANRVAITPTYLSAIEHNRKEPSFSLIRSISHTFGIPQEVLYWDAITFPTFMKTMHTKEIRLAKHLARTVYNQLASP